MLAPPRAIAAAAGKTPKQPDEARGAGHYLAHFPVLQRSAFRVDPAVLRSSGAGRPLPGALRGALESALGADFSAVRVHEGPQAAAVGAVAFAAGSQLVFAPGRYQPGSASGRRLIAHELAHVVQQRAGRVRNPLGGVAVVEDRALEVEAHRLAATASAGLRTARGKGRADV